MPPDASRCWLTSWLHRHIAYKGYCQTVGGFLEWCFLDFLDFGWPDSDDFEWFWRPGGSFWRSWGPFWRHRVFLWFWRHFRHKKLLSFWGQNATTNPLFAMLIFIVFLSARFSWFCVIWRAPRLHFGRLLASLFRPKREIKKVCLDCTGVYGLHIQLSEKCTFAQLFPSLFSEPCAGSHFGSILLFLELPRAPFWRPGLHKNALRKNDEKSVPKRARE